MKMSWWWKSEGRKTEARPASTSSSPSTDNPETHSQPEATPLSRPKKPLTQDEQAELEFREFFAAIQSEEDSRQSRPSSFAPSSHAIFSDHNPSSTDSSTNASKQASIAPESLYSESMSCRSAFDYAFFCQSFGGQWVNIYRYGELRSCSEHWNNFWLCMRTKAYPDEERKEMIRDHYRKKTIKYKTGPSSEDVWEVRTEPLKDAFQGDYAALEKEIKKNELANAAGAAAK
jgi:hypothetical protein